MSAAEALAAPFPSKDVEWRVSHEVRNGKSALVLVYITARAVQARLDSVFGPLGWQVRYEAWQTTAGVKAAIGVRSEHGEWVWKEDGAENTDVEPVKGGFSGAFKRAAVAWGVGRYLYELGDAYAELGEHGDYSHKRKDNTYARWSAPRLPDWALPEDERGKKPPPKTPSGATKEAKTAVDLSKLGAAFTAMGVTAQQIQDFLGHPLPETQDFEAQMLRDIYAAMRAGKTWDKAINNDPTGIKS